jgi:hypothetical protein
MENYYFIVIKRERERLVKFADYKKKKGRRENFYFIFSGISPVSVQRKIFTQFIHEPLYADAKLLRRVHVLAPQGIERIAASELEWITGGEIKIIVQIPNPRAMCKCSKPQSKFTLCKMRNND